MTRPCVTAVCTYLNGHPVEEGTDFSGGLLRPDCPPGEGAERQAQGKNFVTMGTAQQRVFPEQFLPMLGSVSPTTRRD